MLAFAVFALVAADEPVRAELCLAHVNVMIAEADRETGRVAGPSWLVRDWWRARAPREGDAAALTPEQRQGLEASVETRRRSDPNGYQAALRSCVDEAIDGGAVP